MKLRLIQAILVLLILSACVKQQSTFENPNINKNKEETNMELSSPVFENEGFIPKEYTCQGQDISPELHIKEVPAGTKSLVLIMDDPDAPMGTFVHWLVWNISAGVKIIEKNANIKWPQGKNDFGKIGYGGPCPPSGIHRYFFKMYALDATLDLNNGASKKELLDAMEGHIIAKATFMGKYSKI